MTLPFDIGLEFCQKVSVPTLWIGGADSLWSGERLNHWLDHMPEWERRILPSAGHMVQNDNPEALAGEVECFVTGL
jgi:pimeloyl-ACP methyl ester carboxylesterase